MELGLDDKALSKLQEGLYELLANSYTIYLATQNAHWNIEGKEFYSLHIMLEKQYEELAGAIDEIAERIRALGFYVEGRFSSFLKSSSIEQKLVGYKKEELLLDLLKGHETLIRQGRALGSLADSFKDHATVDLIGRRLGVHEKSVWMIRSQSA